MMRIWLAAATPIILVKHTHTRFWCKHLNFQAHLLIIIAINLNTSQAYQAKL